jgi:hypothetical protein
VKSTAVLTIALAFFVLSIPGLRSHAQQRVTVQGVVLDSATGIPVPYAYVSTASHSAAAETDKSGKFSLAIPAGVADSLRVHSLGYRTYSRWIQTTNGGELSLRVKLVPRVVNLEGVTVTGVTPASGKMTLRTLTAEQLMVSKEDDLERALKYLGLLPERWPPFGYEENEVITLYIDGQYISSWSLRKVDPKLVARVRIWKCSESPVDMPPRPHDCNGTMRYVLSLDSKSPEAGSSSYAPKK